MKSARFWVLSCAAATGIAATLALGAWQLGRAHQKIGLQAAIEKQKVLPVLDQRALLAIENRANLLHREVVLRGTWAAGNTVFLDNRQMGGRPGFYVVTPLRLAGSEAAVLVQRGWAPRNFTDRAQLPAVETPGGEVEVRGRIAPPPAKLYEFDSAAQGAIRQNLDLAAFRTETGLALLELSVQQAGAASQGLSREWPQVASGVEKHYGYVFQWWALSALIAILYVWFQFIAPRRAANRA
ncbi:MAG: SURF1 family protein [Comamonadaceae bacterium]|nr:MAG: SURF1 family protein [Comamonadaceae bacterium]